MTPFTTPASLLGYASGLFSGSQASERPRRTFKNLDFTMNFRRYALAALAPALLLVLLPAPAQAAQDRTPPKPRSVPRAGTKRPQIRRPQVKQVTDKEMAAQKKADRIAADKGYRGETKAKALDRTDPDYLKLKAKYAAAGLGEDGYPLPGGKVKGGKGVMPSVPVDPNAKFAIEFGTDRHDFGRAMQGDILSHTFKMAAGGTAPLIIGQVAPTCGCTLSHVLVQTANGDMVPYSYGDPIDPGRDIHISARLNTANKKNATQVRVNVTTNDPVRVSSLTLMANVEQFIQATPTILQLGDVPQGSTRTQYVDVRTTRGAKVYLALDERPGLVRPKGLDVTLSPVNPDEEGRASHWKVEVVVGPDAVEGNLGYQIRMTSDQARPDATELEKKNAVHQHNKDQGGKDKDGKVLPTHQVTTKYQVNVAVTGRILGAMTCSPQFLSMGLVRPGQVVPRTVKLISHDPDFKFDPETMTIEIKGDGGTPLRWAENFSGTIRAAQGVNGVDVELRLEGLPEGADGSFRGLLVIHTGHATKGTMEVHFSGVCRAGIVRKGR